MNFSYISQIYLFIDTLQAHYSRKIITHQFYQRETLTFVFREKFREITMPISNLITADKISSNVTNDLHYHQIVLLLSLSITFISESSAAFLYLFNMTLNSETFDRLHSKTSGPADCVARNIREFRRSHLLARISSPRRTPSIAGSDLKARRGAVRRRRCSS